MKRVVIGLGLCLITWIAAPSPTTAGEAKVKNIEALYAGKDTLKGQRIQVKGKVVKVNTGIMGKNFFHIRDGSGKSGTDDLTITTQDEVRVGEDVVVTGVVAVNRDFGGGYSYPLIVEDATVAKGAGR